MIKAFVIIFGTALNVLVPGSGYILFKKYKFAFITQTILFSIVVGFCLSHWILTTTGMAVFIFTLLLVHFGSFLLITREFFKTKFSVNWRTFLQFFVFCCIGIGIFSAGFMYKDKIFGIHIYFIPSSSMSPTLEPGDFILIDSWAYKKQPPQIGDIVIFTTEAHQGVLVKRVQPWPATEQSFGKYYVMGDNRHESLDSRRFGGIIRKEIKGKVKLILFSIEADLTLRDKRWLKPPSALNVK